MSGVVAPAISVSRTVAAAPSTVWEAVADPERVTAWSPESAAVRRRDGGAGPMPVGTIFTGSNRRGVFRWSTRCRVVQAEPGVSFAFDVTYVGLSVARWLYRLEPVADGTVVHEEWFDHRGRLMKLLGTLGTGVADRETHNRRTMQETLDALAAELGQAEA